MLFLQSFHRDMLQSEFLLELVFEDTYRLQLRDWFGSAEFENLIAVFGGQRRGDSKVGNIESRDIAGACFSRTINSRPAIRWVEAQRVTKPHFHKLGWAQDYGLQLAREQTSLAIPLRGLQRGIELKVS